jgi:hypothetical protein
VLETEGKSAFPQGRIHIETIIFEPPYPTIRLDGIRSWLSQELDVPPQPTNQAPAQLLLDGPEMIEIGPNLAHLLGGILLGGAALFVFWWFGYFFLKVGGFTRKW